MTIYSLAVFIHVTGAIMLGFIIGIEWMMVLKLRKTETREDALTGLAFVKIIGRMSPITWLMILIPGFYMISKAWGWTAWIDTAIAGWLILFIAGALITGRKLTRLTKELEATETLETNLKNQLQGNGLLTGLQLRTCITLAIIFLMTVKPALTLSISALVASLVAGLIPFGRVKMAEVTEPA